MNVVLDHIGAVLVGSVVLLIALGTVVQRSEDGVDAVRSHAVQSDLSSFTDALEVDLDNVGVRLPVGVAPVVELTPDRFAFYGLSGPGGVPSLIEYVRTATGVADGQTTYRVERRVGGARTGGAAPRTVVTFPLLEESGAPVSAARSADLRQIRVRVERPAPFSRGGGASTREVLRRAAWETTVRPLPLQRR